MYDDYLQDPTNEIRANILATALNDQPEWTFQYYVHGGDKQRLRGTTSPMDFRRNLFSDCPDLQIMWDLADAGKHRSLDRPSDPPRVVHHSTNAYYVAEGNELCVTGYNRRFSEAAANAVKYWKNWID